ncbi:hypothetical protein FS842_000959, partial [Serendipita sp. 407]
TQEVRLLPGVIFGGKDGKRVWTGRRGWNTFPSPLRGSLISNHLETAVRLLSSSPIPAIIILLIICLSSISHPLRVYPTLTPQGYPGYNIHAHTTTQSVNGRWQVPLPRYGMKTGFWTGKREFQFA